jgi:Ser/Thr protein kinase RdoA (MazF antagonist)
MRRDVLLSFDRLNTPPAALARWAAAPGSLESVGESENFVYRFRDPSHNERYLRLSHHTHRSVDAISAELDFVNYVADNGIAAARPVPSTSGNLIEVIPTEHGNVHAVAFEAVQGERIQWGRDAQNRKYLFERGKMLGRLHRISQAYQPPGPRRWDWYNDDLFTNPIKYLPPSEEAARREYEDLIHWLLKRPRTPDNYGMVHGDFGTLNTRRRADGTLAVFDFDDCSCHWFLYDVAVAMRSARKLPPKYLKPYVKVILQGYATEKSLNGDGLEEFARFCRLSALYRFISSIRSVPDMSQIDPASKQLLDERREVLANPPQWY